MEKCLAGYDVKYFIVFKAKVFFSLWVKDD
jgi:hypothetical protein